MKHLARAPRIPTIGEIESNPILRAVLAAGRSAGWRERHAIAQAERAGHIEALSSDAGADAPAAQMTAADVRDLFDRILMGEV